MPLQNLNNYKILLASASPRRRELLSQIYPDFEIAPSIEVDEVYPSSMLAVDVAPHLSQLKANAYKSLITDNQLIITADTIVINNNVVLGKPSSKSEAIEMLELLSGKRHNVITGVTITTASRQTTFSANTEVEFSTLDRNEISWYVDKYMPLDKAGAYGIQEWIGCIGVKKINGSFYNVMGLPLHKLYNELKSF